MAEEAKPELVKEGLIVIPLFASALAISYDVGCFFWFDIKLFSLFSTSEHLGFAFEALPLAVMVSVGLFGLAFGMRFPESISVWIDVMRGKRDAKTMKEFEWVRKRQFRLLIVVGVLAIFIAYPGFRILPWTICAMILLFGTTLTIIPAARLVTKLHVTIFVVAAGLLVALATGADFSRSYIKFGKPKHILFVGEEKVETKLIRSGECGVLVFEPVSKELRFIRWDAIKRLTVKPGEKYEEWEMLQEIIGWR
jgi:hypothetical protein